MPEVLLFTLWAPLGAMGEVAVGGRRPSALRPARSAVLGLLAAALGLERSEETAHRHLDEGYGIALRVESPGSLLQDYHTAQVPKARKGRRWATRRDERADPSELGTILSLREYRQEPLTTIAVWALEGAPRGLDVLARALETPLFTLYLGRKSCPLGLPPSPRVLQARTLSEAFNGFVADRPDPEAAVRGDLARAIEAGRRTAPVITADVTPPPGVTRDAWFGSKVERIETRRDRIMSRQGWRFGLRDELVLRDQGVGS
jgi:CRISPR system Cascade subunit CasD